MKNYCSFQFFWKLGVEKKIYKVHYIQYTNLDTHNYSPVTFKEAFILFTFTFVCAAGPMHGQKQSRLYHWLSHVKLFTSDQTKDVF